MFSNISMTGTGLIGLVIGYGLNLLGLTASSDSVQGLAVSVLGFLSILFTFWGQLRRKDLSMGIVRT